MTVHLYFWWVISMKAELSFFCDSKSKESLRCITQFFIDCTFKSASKQFSQMYTIDADFQRLNDEIDLHPVVSAILPCKKTHVYETIQTYPCCWGVQTRNYKHGFWNCCHFFSATNVSNYENTWLSFSCNKMLSYQISGPSLTVKMLIPI